MIKAIIKRPDEKIGHVSYIGDTLKSLQKWVEGYIEVVTISADPPVVMIVNEEGKIRGLEKNFMMGLTPGFQDIIVGTVIVLGVDGEEFADIPISRQQWKTILKGWGNDVD